MASINYLAASSEAYPLVSVSMGTTYGSDPTVYENLVWATTSISKSVLDSAWLLSARHKQHNKLLDAMVAETSNGILSDVLTTGVYRKYNTDLQGQLIIFGAEFHGEITLAHPGGVSVSLPSTDLTTGVLEFTMHTPAQIRAISSTLVTFYESQVEKLKNKVTQVFTANDADPRVTLDMIASITW